MDIKEAIKIIRKIDFQEVIETLNEHAIEYENWNDIDMIEKYLELSE